MGAFTNYYITVNAVNVPASLVMAGASGFKWFPVAFCTFGLAMGLLAYYTFYKQQYYFYHNLGYTKTKLALKVFIINALIAVPILLLLQL